MKRKKNKILVFAAHPDDAEIGMGGTAGKLAGRGWEVKVVDLTDGEPTPCGSPSKRRAESARAASVLGFEREILPWENRRLLFDIKKRDKLAGIIREYRPSAVFIPLEEDPHPDHREAAKIAAGAVFAARLGKCSLRGKPFRVGKVYSYLSIHLKKIVIPDVYVPLSAEEHGEKMRALECYGSQFKKNESNREIPDFIRSRDRYFGYMCSASYGEGFIAAQGEEAGFLKDV